MVVIGSNGELSVIVTCLGCKSVVCLDNHTQWLRRLYVLIFFFTFSCCLWHSRSGGLTLATTNFKGRSWSIRRGCSNGLVATSTTTQWRKRHASTHILDTSGATFCC